MGAVASIPPNCGIILLAVLHLLEPEFNSPHLISKYEPGKYGVFMSLAFFCLGVCSLFSRPGNLSRSPDKRRSPRPVVAPSDWYSVCRCRNFSPVSCLRCRTSPAWHKRAYRDFLLAHRIHVTRPKCSSSGALVRGFPHPDRYDGTDVDRFTLVLQVDSHFFYGIAPGYPAVIVGRTSRFMIVTYCVWLITVAWQVIRITREQKGPGTMSRSVP